LNANLSIIFAKKTKFVGTKTLCAALKFLVIALKNRVTRPLIREHIHSILYDITLPVLLITEKEFKLWSEDAIEYVR
jgi:hypothetical protein